jgi:hypothetical protein
MRFVFLLAVAMALSAPAYAYIDPGAGSMLVQAALAALAGIAVFWRSLWDRVKRWFRRDKQRDE